MRLLKIVGWVAAAAVLLLAVLLLAIWLLVDPNKYKPEIARAVQESTGRELDLKGALKLSVFPWLGVDVGAGSLGNPAGFPAQEPFVAWRRAELRAKLWPLLHKRLEIGRIEIDGLDLRLRKNEAGKGNWQDFGKQQPGSAAPSSSGGAVKFDELGGIKLTNSRISYEKVEITNIEVELGRIRLHEPVSVRSQFEVGAGPQSNKLSVNAAFALLANSEARQYQFDAFDWHGELQRPGASKPLSWKLATPKLSVDLQAQTLDAGSFAAELGAMRLAGELHGRQIVDGAQLQGAFKLDPVSPRQLFGDFGIDAPKTKDAKALERLSLAGHFNYGANSFALSQLQIELDQTHVRGNFALADLDSKALRFDFTVDQIDADRYLPPKKEQPDPTEKPFELPTKPLKALNANGTLAIGKAKLAGIDFNNVRLGVDSHGGLTHIFPSKAQMYGGQYSGDITLDGRGATPVLKLDEHVKGIDMAQLLRDAMKSQRLSGHGDASAKIVARGRDMDAILQSLSGRVDAELQDGAVEGVDLWYELRRAQSLIKTHALPDGASSKRTKFDTFKASADIADGVASTKDLLIASQYLKVTGEGSTDLRSKALDYRLLANILKTPPSGAGDLGELKAVEIPIKVSGTLLEPKVRPDLEGIAKAKLKQKVDEKKDELKQKLQDKLQDKLKGLFGGG